MYEVSVVLKGNNAGGKHPSQKFYYHVIFNMSSNMVEEGMLRWKDLANQEA
jgi:hypothetical protein